MERSFWSFGPGMLVEGLNFCRDAVDSLQLSGHFFRGQVYFHHFGFWLARSEVVNPPIPDKPDLQLLHGGSGIDDALHVIP
jgi:hypothetical protein